MKPITKLNLTIALCALLLLPFGKSGQSFSQQVGISGTAAIPHSSSLLDIDAVGLSPKGGLLIPRLTTTERNAISGPAESLLIYNTTTQCYEGYNSSAIQWVPFGCLGCQLPVAFSATAATNSAITSFTANWTTSTGATTYYLDISTSSSFSSFVSGYDNLSVGNVITYTASTNLTCNTTYYYRIRANNSCGTLPNSNTITVTTCACVSCGSAFVDCRDSKSYNTVLIGAQCWMKENIDYSTSGTYIDDGTAQSDEGTIEKYCYNNVTGNCTTYGGLYSWAEALQYVNGASNTATYTPPGGNIQGICPSGWHIPTDAEWKTMEESQGMCTGAGAGCSGSTGAASARGIATTDGNDLKESGTSHWNTGNTGTNTSNFSALGGGYCNVGTPANITNYGEWWTATENNATTSWRRYMYYTHTGVGRDAANAKTYGFSIRCVAD